MRSPRRSSASSRRCRARRSPPPAGATTARSSWSRTWIEAPALVDRLAPEHLELLVAEPEALAERIRNAGAIFLGAHTPEVIGDYVGGPNHVLPTDRTARFASGLSVYDFLKRTTLLACDAASFAALGPAAAALARAEGLAGHARASSCAWPPPTRHERRRRRARIVDIRLDAASIVRWSREVEHERQVAVFDLLERNSFELVERLRRPVPGRAVAARGQPDLHGRRRGRRRSRAEVTSRCGLSAA